MVSIDLSKNTVTSEMCKEISIIAQREKKLSEIILNSCEITLSSIIYIFMAFIHKEADDGREFDPRRKCNQKLIDKYLLGNNQKSNNNHLGLGGLEASQNVSSLRMIDSLDDDSVLDSLRIVDQSSQASQGLNFTKYNKYKNFPGLISQNQNNGKQFRSNTRSPKFRNNAI